jgi:hypothetical protein
MLRGYDDLQHSATLDSVAEPILDAIRAELFRLRADEASVGPAAAIYVRDRGHGNAVLQGSTRGQDFDWFGSGEVILERLRSLPEDSGPEAIRSEFA